MEDLSPSLAGAPLVHGPKAWSWFSVALFSAMSLSDWGQTTWPGEQHFTPPRAEQQDSNREQGIKQELVKTSLHPCRCQPGLREQHQEQWQHPGEPQWRDGKKVFPKLSPSRSLQQLPVNTCTKLF